MSLSQLYECMSGAEIDERMAAALLESPEYQKKMAEQEEQERFDNMSPEEQAQLLMQLFNKGK